VVIPGESFDAEDVLAAVEAEGCTSLYGVPTMFIDELGHPDFDDFDLTTLRTGIMAGAPCPVEVMKQVRSRMHMRGHDRLRHDRNLAPVDPDRRQ
jgi:fatty-acyl-CoA synthase